MKADPAPSGESPADVVTITWTVPGAERPSVLKVQLVASQSGVLVTLLYVGGSVLLSLILIARVFPRLVPCSVTVSRPLMLPWFGLRDVTVGSGRVV